MKTNWISSLENQPYWKALLVNAFRLPIRLAIQMNKAQLRDLNHLMRIALIKEMAEQGLAQRPMTRVLDVSLGSIKSMYKSANSINNEEGLTGDLCRILQHLERHESASDKQIAPLCSTQANQNALHSSLKALLTLDLVKKENVAGKTHYRLTNTYFEKQKLEWMKPIKKTELAWYAAIQVLHELSKLPLNFGQLCESHSLKGVPEMAIQEAIHLLKEQGFVQKKLIADAICLVATNKTREQAISSDDAQTRHRTGLMQFINDLTTACESMAFSEDITKYGQRTFHFQARESDFLEFVQKHRAAVRRELEGCEAQLATTHGAGKNYMMTWSITETSL